MKRLLMLVGAASLVLAACGDDDDDNASATVPSATSGEATTTGSPSGSASGSATVMVAQIDGVGSVLTDANGMVLYMNDEEAADSSVLCDKECADEWPPLAAGSSTPTGAAGVTGLATADRPDGTSQVTYQGHRLYTFADDSPGQASGNGDSDDFDGQQFSWHAVTLGSAGASSGATTMPSGTTQASDTPATTGY